MAGGAMFWIGFVLGIASGIGLCGLGFVLGERSPRHMPDHWRRETWRQHGRDQW